MAQVKFTPNLKRFFPDLCPCEIEAATVAEIVAAVDKRWRGLGDYIIDEQGALRKHVNIFVGDELLRDKQTLTDRVSADTRIFIVQALSGG
ncbi:MAG: molybdenum cofactor biosynthesis protein MoaD [Chloroflexota bacterium]|nr:molybdenum cofactor biosynthesis protein MoaD [Chloroflexota bacterium]MDE2855229.1 molybdenum cofactor biosynthesis protein MoaD [Chloroflexota bacterium]MDE2947653.1 molybdenum cofactor biosynthesis protein MoaD [Chloroflexota bacterium]